MEAVLPQATRSLRTLYGVRTAFQLLWAAAFLSLVKTRPEVAGVLLVGYPLWDVACTIYDLRTAGQTGSARTVQLVNALLGVAAAVGIALTISSRPPFAIAAFGVWALAAGLLQLAVGVVRRKALGGQWPLILSGAQSSAAGVSFVLGGLSGKLHTKDLGGYAVFGAVYFLVGAVLLQRKLAGMQVVGGAAREA